MAALQLGLTSKDEHHSVITLRNSVHTNYVSRADLYGSQTTQVDEGDGFHTVRLVALDTLQFDKLDFMKVDIEGMEEKALRGAKESIIRCKPVLYVENNHLSDGDVSASLVRSCVFSYYV